MSNLSSRDLERLVLWNSTDTPYEQGLRLGDLIRRTVKKTPSSVAVRFEGRDLTYAELDRKAWALATKLRGMGIGPGDLVGVCLDRSTELVVAFVGVVYSGAAYVPLDPAYPHERVARMCEEAQVKVVVTRDGELQRTGSAFPACIGLVTIDEGLLASLSADTELIGTPDDPAYVIFTSGSTGRPKGAMNSHKAIVNRLQWTQQEYLLTPHDRVVQKTPCSFDVSVWEFFWPLMAGATIVVARPDGHRDANYLAALIEAEGVTLLHFVPSMLRVFLEEPRGAQCRSVRQVLCSGEALPIDAVDRFFDTMPNARLGNLYGPTEAAVDVTYWNCVPHDVRRIVPIGRPVANTRMYVLDESHALLPVGHEGELYIGGVQVGMGYVSRPDLTEERFLPDPYNPGGRMYKTGDVARWLEDGVIEYLGRADHQVKIRGNRVELGEIEVALMGHLQVARCVVVALDFGGGDARLVAYVVPRKTIPSVSSMREHLAVHLPDYMIPQRFVSMDEIPLLPNGKVNRHALPPPSGERPDLSVPYQSPVNPLEVQCCKAFASVLNLDQVGRHDNFFDLGGSSLLAMQVLVDLSKATGQRLTAPTIFAHPDPASLAQCLTHQDAETAKAGPVVHAKRGRRNGPQDDPIAIIGMSGRFPGANTVETLWDNLVAGKDSITHFTNDALDQSIQPSLRNDPNYVKARGIVDDVEWFDNSFFGISAREAEVMDPQHRIFLEVAWECLERAGYAPDQVNAPVGVFAGANTPTYFQRHVMAHPDVIERLGEFQVMVGNDKDYVATRVAHKLNLKGPAIAVNTACSTSLVAIAQAVDSLRLGRCDMALAGAASVSAPHRSGYLYQEGAMLSKDGHTRTFDAQANGTAFNDGAAVVLLKRLSDALADGDQVFAVIRGIATNNDGGGKASFTAPSVQGQAAVVAAAHEDAGVDPRSISYVEAHGTATPLGDPVEVEGLTRAFRQGTRDTGFCRIGSVKSNVGHLITAAGATGVIKTALALATEQLPASIHFERPNPHIDFANSPFVVNSHLTAWPRAEQPRRAGVSSFGVGGTNAHAVLEEAPLSGASPPAKGPQQLRLSAKNPAALDVMAAQLADHLDAHPNLNLADVAHTLRVGRSQFSHRLCVVGSGSADLSGALRTSHHPQRAVRSLGAGAPSLVWLFPGQGAQYAGMGRELYAQDDAFRAAFDECLEALQTELPFDLKHRMFDGSADSLMATGTTQPATFVFEYALARSWLAKGMRPAALVGHSVGEFAAAVLAGVMPLPDAARLVAKRGALMQALPGGSMLSVRLSLEKLLPLLPPELSLAAENGPAACVVAGPTPALDAWRLQLETEGVVARMLQTSHAFHSSMMDAAVGPFEMQVRGIHLYAPQIPIISTLTGKPMLAAEASDPRYWARHMREPVRFSAALRSVLASMDPVFLEVGPRGTLATLARQHMGAGKRAATAIPSIGDSPESEATQVALAQGHLWTLGIDLPALADLAAEGRRRVLLPTYPFERKRFWLDAAPATPITPVVAAAPPAAASVPPSEPSPVTVRTSVENAMSTTTNPTLSNALGSRLPLLIDRLRELFEDVAGLDIGSDDQALSFIELGLDSLSLTQAALQVRKTFDVSITFRQLMEKYRSLDTLAQFLDAKLPADRFTAPAAPVAATATTSESGTPTTGPFSGDMGAVLQVLQQQMQLMTQQLAVLSGLPLSPQPLQAITKTPPPTWEPPSTTATTTLSAPAEMVDSAQPSIKSLVERPFGASPRLTLEAQQDFTSAQRCWLDDFIVRYNARSGKSKSFSQEHRKLMADPRVVTGFNPLWKDLVYPIVVDRSKGASLWDLDGNEYIDLLSCFGGNLLGYQPADVIEALGQQLQLGLEVGPQHPMAAEVAHLISEFTGMERVGFCNTGSEAVMGAMRIARTVTGRKTIAIFSNSYHGIFDEVIVRGTKQLRSLSAAPGILANAVENILVLDWNSEDSLRVLRERGSDLAAILTEPIQNKHPTIQPREFLLSLRQIADKASCALIFDEVVTGFRVAPGGAQEFYGVRADIATYGKVIGGGLPFAAIAGNANWLDALDGGHWQYGDDSYPEAGVTYFAGTFVRHPLALAAARATLLHIKKGGREFYRNLNDRTQRLIDRLNTAFAMRGAPVKAVHCASIWRLQWDDNQKYTGLFYYLLRFHGLHVYEQFGHFVTEGMTDEHTDRIYRVFTDAIDELMGLGFIALRSGRPTPNGGSDRSSDARTEGPLTPGQSERWLAGSFAPSARRALNESLCVSLKGKLDQAALKQALQDVLTRHETFRVCFSLDEPRQMLAPAGPFPVTAIDLTHRPDADQALDDFCSEASSRDFPLDQAPLAAVSLLNLADGRTVVHVVACHLVFDGWASSVFNVELATAYKARSIGLPPAFKTAESPLKFAEEEQARFEGADGQAALRFWKEQLQSPPAPLSLGDRTPPTPRTFAGDTQRMLINGELFDQLRTQARLSDATLFQVLLTAVTMALHQRSGQSEFVVCVPYASQNFQRRGPLMADGVLDLPLRLGCSAHEPMDVVLARVRARLMDALEFPLVTQAAVARALGIRSTGDRPALTRVYFNLNPKIDLSSYAPLAASVHEGRKRGLLGELFFNFYELDNALTLDLHHSSEFFSPGRAQELIDGLVAQCARFANASAPLVTPTTNRQPAVDPRLLAWNSATTTSLEPHARLEQWVSRQAAASPDAVALVAQGVTLCYAALESRANRFFHVLRARGIGPGTLVGVCLNRGPDLVPSLLGILKTGAAYVPLDPSFPKDRLHHMAEDAGVQLVITDSTNASLPGLAREQQLRIDDDAATLAAAPDSGPHAQTSGLDDAPTYVIYTSGSTGKPKGVVLPQKAVCNFLASMRHEPGLTSSDRLLAVTTLSFDIAVLELFLPLITGACVVLAEREDAMDGEALSRLLAAQRINVMQATPTTWHMLLDAGWRAPAGFRALCGGEPLPPSLAERLLEAGVELWNMYGPTETTVWSTLCRITDPKRKITIGRPIANTQVWVLDEQLKPCAIGQEGELCIGGAGVATGYFNRPDLTAEKFVPDPFAAAPGTCIYRTGDLARWCEDGTLEHLGRLDFQVKIRGYRIELGEIEARMADLPGVARTVVVAREDGPGDVRLVGYVVPQAEHALNPGHMRDVLRSALPDYMLPHQIVLLDDLPLLPNGKIDRKSLPIPTVAAVLQDGQPPRNELERQLAAAMASVLKLKAVDIEDDFFSLGGHSLLAARLMAQINRELGLQLALRTLFESPTVEKLAAAVSKARGADAAPPRAPILRRQQQDTAPLTLMQERINFVERMQPGRLAYHAPSGHRLRGPMNLDAFDRAFQEVVKRQDAFRTAIAATDKGFVQRVDQGLTLSLLPVTNLSGLTEQMQEKALLEDMNRQAGNTFQFNLAPLIQARLYKLADDHHALFLMPHHLVWDGWSFDIFYSEMAAHYQAFLQEIPSPLPPLKFSYGDFAAWHKDWMQSEEMRAQTAYWRNQLGAPRPRIETHTDKPRPQVSSGQAATEHIFMDATLVAGLQDLARQTGSTTSIVLLAAYAALMSQWMDEPTPTIGLPVRGRPVPELESVMGFFNNLLPLRLHIDLSLSMTNSVRRMRQQVTEAIANQDVPFERISQELNLPAGGIYQALFNFQDVRGRQTRWGDLQHERIHVTLDGATEDMNLWLVEEERGISGGFKYDPDIFLASSVAALRDRFVQLLADGTQHPEQSLATLLAPSSAELAAVSAWEAASPALAASDVLDLVVQRWQSKTEGAALRIADRIWTGHELVSELTRLDTARRASTEGERQPIMRTSDDPFHQIVGLMVPAHTDTSELHNVSVGRVTALLGGLSDAVKAKPSDTWLCCVDSERPLFTFLQAVASLCAGASTVLVPWSAHRAIENLGTLIRENKATIVHAPGADWDRWLASPEQVALRGVTAVLDTAVASPVRVDRLLAAGLSVVNVYREAELGLPLAAGALEHGSEAARFGRPLQAGLLKLTDTCGQQTAPGVPGELQALAPSGGEGQWQATGTRARWRIDGQLQYLGGFGGASFALQPVEVPLPGLSAAPTFAMTAAESEMLGLWCELMCRSDIGLDDNFFDLGGYSLLAMELIAKIEIRMGKKIQPASLLEFPTVRRLTELVERSKGQSSLLKLRAGTNGHGVFFIHDIDGEVLLYRNLAMRLNKRHPVYALRPHADENMQILHTRLSEMADHYVKQIRDVQPEGPYILAGLCAGGELAFEVACRLQAQGQHIATLALLESAHASAEARPKLLSQRRIAKLKQELNEGDAHSAVNRVTHGAFAVMSKTLSVVRYEVSSRIAQIKLDAQLRKLQSALDSGSQLAPGSPGPTVRQVIAHAQKSARTHGRYTGDALLLRARKGDGTLADQPFVEVFVDPLFGWAKGIEGKVVIADVEGGHSSMLQEPFVASTHAALQAHIDEALTAIQASRPNPAANISVHPGTVTRELQPPSDLVEA